MFRALAIEEAVDSLELIFCQFSMDSVRMTSRRFGWMKFLKDRFLTGPNLRSTK
jgi:hypothetical protein